MDSYNPNTNFSTKLRAAKALVVPPGESDKIEDFSPKPGPSGLQNDASTIVVTGHGPEVDPFDDDMDIDLDNLESMEKPKTASEKLPDIIFEGQIDVTTAGIDPPKESIILGAAIPKQVVVQEVAIPKQVAVQEVAIPKQRPVLRDITNQMKIFEYKNFEANFFSDYYSTQNTVIKNQQIIIAREQASPNSTRN